MYGPGDPSQQQYQQYPQAPQVPQPAQQATAVQEPQPPQQEEAPAQQWMPKRGGTLLVIAAGLIMLVAGGINAASGPLGYLDDVNAGVVIVGANPLLLAVCQTGLGAAWVLFGILVLAKRRIGWGGALVVSCLFAIFESYFIVRGAVVHFAGLFTVVAVLALLYQAPLRRHCRIGPPSR